MNKEILLVVDVVSNEKGVDKEIIFEAIEAALASSARKKSGKDIEVAVKIDRETGDYETFRRWEAIADDEPMEFPLRQMSLSAVQIDEPDKEIGDYTEEQIDNVDFGRIAAQTAKQVIVQKVREAERKQIIEAYEDRVGELVTGVVKRMERGNVYIDLGGRTEAIIYREELIPREALRPGDRVRGYLYEVSSETRGPQLFISRTRPEFLIELFKLEVPEVGQDLINIMGASRDPGLRAKIAVKSNDSRIDPIGACVGMRGSRVQTISNELSGERVDIILWDENPAQFVINAMSPAEVESIMVDEDSESMDIAVADDQLSQAIGRGGQNVKLASELTDWVLNVMSESDAETKSEAELEKFQKNFVKQLDVDEEVATILAQEGFTTIEEIAYVPASELADIEEFDEAIVEELRNRARDVMLTQAIVAEEVVEGAELEQELKELEGMDEELAKALLKNKILTLDDFAGLATDELLDIHAMEQDRAAAMIIKAREHWFTEEAQEQG
ncbi:MAG TPA: transcription termination/antitermination protein NusA [Gammaproteobacteria bacterium]|nr:transcription termination/antitermination protein NusA [Gammaproteobacteria bacterium]